MRPPRYSASPRSVPAECSYVHCDKVDQLYSALRIDVCLQAQVVDIAQIVVICVFNEHIAELDLDAVDVLTSKVERQSSPLPPLFVSRDDETKLLG